MRCLRKHWKIYPQINLKNPSDIEPFGTEWYKTAMTERMIERFGSPEAAHRAFEEIGLDDFKSAVEELRIEPQVAGRVYYSVRRCIMSTREFSSIAEIAASHDDPILKLEQVGETQLGYINEALDLIADGL